MFDAITALGQSIAGIVTTAIAGDWGGLATSIVETVRDSIGVGSATIDSSSSAIDLGSSALDLGSSALELSSK